MSCRTPDESSVTDAAEAAVLLCQFAMKSPSFCFVSMGVGGGWYEAGSGATVMCVCLSSAQW